jgi:hypothetical protein
MQRRTECPKCRKRMARRRNLCVGCGARTETKNPLSGLRPAHAVGFLLLLAICGTVAASLADRYLPAVTDWYLEMAVPYLGEGASPFLGAAPDDSAYYACVRSVVKRIDEEGTIATFAGPRASRTHTLGEGRYRIESFVTEAAEDGGTAVRSFTCTVKSDGTRWAIEDLEVQPYLLARTGS